MLHSATWSGMRTLAGDYREGDIRRATIARTATPEPPARAVEPVATAAGPQLAVAGRFARLVTLLTHAR